MADWTWYFPQTKHSPDRKSTEVAFTPVALEHQSLKLTQWWLLRFAGKDSPGTSWTASAASSWPSAVLRLRHSQLVPLPRCSWRRSSSASCWLPAWWWRPVVSLTPDSTGQIIFRFLMNIINRLHFLTQNSRKSSLQFIDVKSCKIIFLFSPDYIWSWSFQVFSSSSMGPFLGS